MALGKMTTLLCISMVMLWGCGQSSPVQNYANTPISAESGHKNLKQIEKDIKLAGVATGWQIQTVKPGHFVATLFRSGHMAKVNIYYTANQYSIKYKDSSNLQYDGTNIASKYNDWVKKLHNKIRERLSKR